MFSIEDVYKEHSHMVYRYLLSLTHDADLAEELTQETFFQAVKSVGHFSGGSKVSTWLCGIAKNVFLAHLRKHPPTEPLTENSTLEMSAEAKVLSSFEKMELLRKIHNLKDPGREVILLRIYGNLSYGEIGEIMGKSENWARVTFYRAKEQLRKEFRNYE